MFSFELRDLLANNLVLPSPFSISRDIFSIIRDIFIKQRHILFHGAVRINVLSTW